MAEVIGDMSITLDGYAAGEGQGPGRPLGDIDVGRLHGWMFDHAEENTEEMPANLVVEIAQVVIAPPIVGAQRNAFEIHGFCVTIPAGTLIGVGQSVDGVRIARVLSRACWNS